MKHCGTCGKNKFLTDFNKNKSKKDGLNTICRECSRKRSRQYYKENTTKHKKNVLVRNRKYRKENRQRQLEYFQTHHCVDCGFSHPAALQFDHINPDEKSKNVSHMIGECYKWDSILKEIEKCVVRCANCHSIRTAEQFNWYCV